MPSTLPSVKTYVNAKYQSFIWANYALRFKVNQLKIIMQEDVCLLPFV
jgi:hypothetical protein